MKKLIIVCDKTTEKHGNYLRQLISANDDNEDIVVGVKDGEVDAVVWNEEQYKANSPTINSTQHILFIGDGSITKNESVNIKFVHDNFGMKYGWIGKRAVAFVDKSLSENEYNDFLEYCKKFGKEHEKISFKLFSDFKKKFTNSFENNDGKQQNALFDIWKDTAIATSITGLLGGISMLGAHGFNALVTSGKVKEQQYSALITILYLNDLANFMES